MNKKNTIPKRNQRILEGGLLPGDIILLWRINFGTFTNKSWFPKYFQFDYGIDGIQHMENLLKEGYAVTLTAMESLKHLNAGEKREILKAKNIKGLSGLKVSQLDTLIKANFTEEELKDFFDVRGYGLTEKGKKALSSNKEVVDYHPKKM